MQTILVVDDEESIVEVLACVFESEGYRVLKASDGIAAYELLHAHRVDLVVSDYMMPGLNGIELYFRMVEDPDLEDVPFIMISAFSAELVATPFTAVFGKPFDMQKLVATVKTALSTKAPVSRTSPLKIAGPV